MSISYWALPIILGNILYAGRFGSLLYSRLQVIGCHGTHIYALNKAQTRDPIGQAA
jgi:hypothetical protein